MKPSQSRNDTLEATATSRNDVCCSSKVGQTEQAVKRGRVCAGRWVHRAFVQNNTFYSGLSAAIQPAATAA